MGVLIRTLLDISLLRKGPEAIPTSWLLFLAAVLLRSIAVLLGVALIESFSLQTVRLDLLVWLIGLLCFGTLVVAAGKSERLASTLTALAGIGAIVTFAMLVVMVVGQAFLVRDDLVILAQLMLLWSVVIKGHIIAKTLNWHWYAGFIVSIGVLLFQLVAPSAMIGGT